MFARPIRFASDEFAAGAPDPQPTSEATPTTANSQKSGRTVSVNDVTRSAHRSPHAQLRGQFGVCCEVRGRASRRSLGSANPAIVTPWGCGRRCKVSLQSWLSSFVTERPDPNGCVLRGAVCLRARTGDAHPDRCWRGRERDSSEHKYGTDAFREAAHPRCEGASSRGDRSRPHKLGQGSLSQARSGRRWRLHSAERSCARDAIPSFAKTPSAAAPTSTPSTPTGG